MKIAISKLKDIIKESLEEACTCESEMKESEEKTDISSKVPWGLTPHEYAELALLCLDQSGLDLHAQEKIKQIVDNSLGLAEVDERSEPSPIKDKMGGDEKTQHRNRPERPLHRALGMK